MTQKNKHRLDKWVSDNYNYLFNEIYKNITTSPLMKEYTSDLFHHILEDVYKLSDEKIEQMLDDDLLKNWILRSASLQLRSKTSPFYHIFRKHKFTVRENFTSNHPNKYDSFNGKGILEQIYEPYAKPDFEVCFEEEWKKLHPYQRTIIEKKLMEGWSYQQLFEYYNISKRHLIKDINETIQHLRDKCNNC